MQITTRPWPCSVPCFNSQFGLSSLQTEHGSIPTDSLAMVCANCAAGGIDYVVYDWTMSHNTKDEGSFLRVWNQGSREFQDVEHFFEEGGPYDSHTIKRLNKYKHVRQKKDLDRGNNTLFGGYCGNQSNGRKDSSQAVTKPSINRTHNAILGNIMVEMSKLLLQTNPSLQSIAGDHRSVEFAGELAEHDGVDTVVTEPPNREGITDARSKHWQYLTFHVDEGNSEASNREQVMVAVQITHTDRSAAIGYCKKSIDDYYRRNDRVGKAAEDMTAYFAFVEKQDNQVKFSGNFLQKASDAKIGVVGYRGEELEYSKRKGQKGYFYLDEKSGDKKPYHGIPFLQLPRQMDKGGALYDVMAWGLMQVLKRHEPSFPEVVEIVACGVYLNSIGRWMEVMVERLANRKSLPNECITWWFLKEMGEGFDRGINGGPVHRIRGPWNKEFIKRRVVAAVAMLHKKAKAVRENSKARPTIRLFNQLLYAFMAIPGSGELTAQHGLQPALRCGLFGDKVYALTNYAVLSPGTKTFKKLSKRYGINTDQGKQILQGVVAQIGVTPVVAENGLCEFGKSFSLDDPTPQRQISSSSSVALT